MNKTVCHCELCNHNGCMCQAYSRFFSVLGNNNRLHIITALRQGPLTVSELMAATKIEQTCVSHCLRALTTGGFVTSTRDGKYRIYALNKQAIEPLMDLIDTHARKYFLEEGPIIA